MEGRAQPEGEEGAVVEQPLDGDLDEGRRARVQVGPERVEEVAGVEEAVPAEQVEGLVGDLVEGSAVADGQLARDAGQDVGGLLEDLLLLGPGAALEPLVEVAVVADLVAAPVDLGDRRRVALGRPPRDEEGRGEAVPVQEVQDQRHADLGSIGALGEDADPVDVLRIARDPRRLGVEVEGQAHRGPNAAGPSDRRLHGCLPVGRADTAGTRPLSAP